MVAFEKTMVSWMSQYECTRTPGPRMERQTWLPETMQPMETSESVAEPLPPVFVEHELGRRELRLVGAQRPVGVVEVEDGVHLDEVHGRFVVGVQRAHVAPVLRLLLVLVPEEVGENAFALVHQVRDDVLAEVVAAAGLLGVAHQLADSACTSKM